MKTLVAIPSRYLSSRFPGKPLALISGRPMIEWVVRGVLKSSFVKDVVVMTDDKRIFDSIIQLCKSLEFKNVRPLMTSEHCETGTDRIYDGLIQLEKLGQDYDYVINVQGDEPLISDVHLNPLFEKINSDSKFQMMTLGTTINSDEIKNMNCVKVLIDKNSDAIYFSRFPVPYSRETEMNANDGSVLKHIGLYGYSVQFLKQFCATPMTMLEKSESLEQLRALHLGAKIRVVQTPHVSMGIDTPDDLKMIEEKIKIGEIKI
jgi:3-deoxy-manno-octulosonate cytidylyltransferase (CMP-KDO synthetase)